MKIIRAVFLSLLGAAVFVYLCFCIIGNTWNPEVSINMLIAASSSSSEKIVREGDYATGAATVMPEGFSKTDGYVYFKHGEVNLEQAFTKLGFIHIGGAAWTAPDGDTVRIESVSYGVGGKIVHYSVIGEA